MTDASPGPGWWLASDGQWYPPHLHPDVRARQDDGTQPESRTVDTIQHAPDEPVTTTADDNGHGWVVGNGADEPVDAAPRAADVPAATAGYAVPTQYVPEREPIDWAKVAADRSARRQANESRRRRKFVGATLASIGTLAVLVAVARNDGNDDRDGLANTPEAATTTDAPTSSELATTTTAAVTATTVPGSVSVFTLLPGTCVSNADLTSGLVTTVTEVPCDQPHTHEVYHKVTYTPPDGAYNVERISQFASEQCSQSFAAYVGIPYDRSKYYFLNFAPTEESWTQKGDREVVCLLFLQGSQLTGSAKGTAQ